MPIVAYKSNEWMGLFNSEVYTVKRVDLEAETFTIEVLEAPAVRDKSNQGSRAKKY